MSEGRLLRRKWYEDDKGNVSTVRLISLPTAIVGLAITVASTVAFFMRYTDSTLLGGIGVALVTLATGSKTLQKKFEQ